MRPNQTTQIWSRFFGFIRSEKPPSREVISPGQPQRGLRRPLEQPKPPAKPSKNCKAAPNQVFFRAVLENYASNHDTTSSLRTFRWLYCRRSFSRGASGLRQSAQHNCKSDRLLAGAVRNNQLPPAALGGRRVPSLSSLVANVCSSTLLRFSYFRTLYVTS